MTWTPSVKSGFPAPMMKPLACSYLQALYYSPFVGSNIKLFNGSYLHTMRDGIYAGAALAAFALCYCRFKHVNGLCSQQSTLLRVKTNSSDEQ